MEPKIKRFIAQPIGRFLNLNEISVNLKPNPILEKFFKANKK